MEKLFKSKALTLRQRAEEHQEKQHSVSEAKLSETDILKLRHELEVHQIELAMQNEELADAKNKLEHVSNNYKELYDYAPSAYFTLAVSGKIIELNLIGAKMLGKERSHLIDSTFSLYVSMDNRLNFSQFIDDIFKSNVMNTCELNLSTNAGQPMNVYLTGILAGHGEKCHLTMVDVTEHKLVEKEMQKLLRVVEQSPESIIITNITGEIEYANPTIANLSGYTIKELIGKNPRIFNSGEKTKEEYTQLWNTIISGKIWQGEFHNKKKSGELYWESATISPLIDTSGNITNFVAIREDITEKKNHKKDMITATEHAGESDRLKSTFLANMSHEIRTPLNSIIGFSELLIDSDIEENQRREYIQQIITNGNILLSIINDIMDMSRLESGVIAIHKEQINVMKLVTGLIQQFTFHAQEKKLTLKLSIPDTDREAVIYADSLRIMQIFNNLVGNALKFTEKGVIEISYQQQDKKVEFQVRDSGIGIAQEFHQKVFDRFRQVETSTTRKFGGNGLGLAITKNLVELMGGKIWLISEPGIGSAFYFTMPCEEKARKE